MRRAQVLINGEFIALGLDGAARTSMRLGSAAQPVTGDPGEFNFSRRPFEAKIIERGTRLAQAMSLSAAEERAFASMMPALFAFFDVAQSTAGLKAILGEVVDEGSLILSFLRHGGKLEPYFRNDSS